MKKTNERLSLSAEKVAEELKAIGEELTIEEVEKMLESMQQIVALAINQYFRKASDSRRNSSTK